MSYLRESHTVRLDQMVVADADDGHSSLSLTKWIHLHGLDEGLMRFFRKCFDCLASDGKLVLEKQGWRGYKDAKRSSQVRPFLELSTIASGAD